AGATIGIAFTLMAAAPRNAVVIAACVAFGAASALVTMASQVQIQCLVPLSAGGRVLGTLEGLGQLSMAAGVWVAARIIEGWSLSASLATLALLTVLGTLAVTRSVLRTDARVAATRQRLDALDRITLFAPLTNVLRERIASQLHTEEFTSGDVVIYQG